VANVFRMSRQTLAQFGLTSKSIDSIRNPDWLAVNRDIEWLNQSSHQILNISDDHYPALLKEISAPPPVLFTNGDDSVLSLPKIAIVGSRNPSSSGAKTAYQFSATLSTCGLCITSGLALGIDAAAHRGAIEGGGKTIAVTGTGLDRVYPAKHHDLAKDISENGLLLSEFSLGSSPKAGHFPQRNRIISGLSMGVLVVEAAIKSGSLITAKLALEQGREVFAIPGSIHNPLARGCNYLIKEGAKLVETAEDVLEELLQLSSIDSQSSCRSLDDVELDQKQKKILNFVAYSPTSIDTLVRETDESPETIASILLFLELQGYVEMVAGGSYSRLM